MRPFAALQNSRARRRLVVGGLLLLCLLAALCMSPAFALSLAPVWVLGLLLGEDRYVGERTLERLRARRRRSGRPRPVAGVPLPDTPRILPVGRRLAFALAMRPPPVLSA